MELPTGKFGVLDLETMDTTPATGAINAAKLAMEMTRGGRPVKIVVRAGDSETLMAVPAGGNSWDLAEHADRLREFTEQCEFVRLQRKMGR